MKVSAHQPCLLPWVGFWNKVVCTDAMVLLNGVKFSRGDYMNRVLMGESWLTVPVVVEGETLQDTLIDRRALPKVVRTIEQAMMTRKHPYRDRLVPLTEFIRAFQGDRLIDLTLPLTQLVASALGASTAFIEANDWSDKETPSLRLREVLERYTPQITEYYSGGGALGYMNPVEFKHPIKMQSMKAGVSGDSVLQLIALDPYPLERVKACATWLNLGE